MAVQPSALPGRRVAAEGMVIQVAGGTGRKWYGGDTSLTVRMFITMALLLVVYGVFLGILYQAGANFITMAVVAGAFVIAQYFFSDRLVLLTTGAREVSPEQAPELHDIIDRLAAMADLPK